MSEVDWFPIATAPKPGLDEPPVMILLAWNNIDRVTGALSRHVGEGYWNAENDRGDGEFWWANAGPGNYHSSPISDSITGVIYAWAPMPTPPVWL